MDRRPAETGPGSTEDEAPQPQAAAPPEPLSEAEWDRILPPIDEGDPDWQAYVKRKVQESIDDPRPSVPAEEAFAQVYAHIERRRAAKRGDD
jgi:hypothetical protein